MTQEWQNLLLVNADTVIVCLFTVGAVCWSIGQWGVDAMNDALRRRMARKAWPRRLP